MISIITLNYNQNEYTIKCIESVLKTKKVPFELLLVENGSEPDHYEALRQSLPEDDRLKLLRLDQNRGYVGGVNYGLEQVDKDRTTHIVVMNNDTIIDELAIAHLHNCCVEKGNRAIVTGKVYHYNDPDRFQDVGYSFKKKSKLMYHRIGLNEKDVGQFDTIEERAMIDDIYWMFPLALYEEIGGYSHYFWFNAEQADFALRAKKAGYKLFFTPLARLWHKGSVSIGGRDQNPRLAYWNVQSALTLRYIHLDRMSFLSFYLTTLTGIFATSFKSLGKSLLGDFSLWRYASAKHAGHWYFVKWLFLKNENVGKNPY